MNIIEKANYNLRVAVTHICRGGIVIILWWILYVYEPIKATSQIDLGTPRREFNGMHKIFMRPQRTSVLQRMENRTFMQISFIGADIINIRFRWMHRQCQ